MMIKGYNKMAMLVMLAMAMVIPFSCTDLDYDQPPAGGQDPNIPTNTTIAEIKAMHTLGQYEEITDDAVLSALVISNDRAGNFFKQLVIQDATGGIEMRVDVADLHALYPVGRKIYLRAKGLWLGDYNGLIQLGAGEGVDDQGKPELIRIPESILSNYIIPATYGNPVVPKVVTLDQLSLEDVSTLIQLDGMQFITADAGKVYADSALSTNRDIEDCAHRILIMRNSGYSDFRGQLTPTGNGTVIGILGVYRDDFQFMIRDTDDVHMNGDRCGSGGGMQFTIAAVRQLFAQGTTTAPTGTIRGTVISDYTSGSVTGKNAYIQDATGGIVVRFTENHTLALGDEVSVNIGGGTLELFSGLFQVNNLDPGGVTVLSHPGDVTPRLTTVLEALTNAASWESTLIKIDSVTLTDNTTFNGTVTVTDQTGSMVLFTRSFATFANDPLPSGKVSITAILNIHDSPELLIRNRDDVKGGGSTGGGEINAASIRQSFMQGATTAPNGQLKGIVISDYASASIHGLSMYLQYSTGGIVVRFTGDHLVPAGAEVSVTINGGTLSEFNGLLQINGIAPTNVSILGTPGDPTPRVATVKEVLDNAEAWESTLVLINGVTLSGAATYNGSINVTDGTGTIVLFTRSAATFSGDAIPSGTVNITAIVSEFNTTQLIIRTTADID
jgi:hypothetical protein